MQRPDDPRVDILDEAKDLVTNGRNTQYGEPEDNFRTIAEMWTSYLHSRGLIPRDQKVETYDVAQLMMLLKLARGANNPLYRDNWADAIGYAAAGWRCAVVAAGEEGEGVIGDEYDPEEGGVGSFPWDDLDLGWGEPVAEFSCDVDPDDTLEVSLGFSPGHVWFETPLEDGVCLTINQVKELVSVLERVVAYAEGEQ